MDNTPFFLIGCVRSGTTLLRNLLRKHPRLESPEETHFFRWAEPFGTERYKDFYRGSKLFRKHITLDGITEQNFFSLFDLAKDKKEMADNYGKLFLKVKCNEQARWFDKTPQNIYGVLLLNSYYPNSKFIHIYRNPLNVVSSLMEGIVMPKSSIDGAINYWTETMRQIEQIKPILGDRLYEISYEALCKDSVEFVRRLINYLGEDASVYPFEDEMTHPEKDKYLEKLDSTQVEYISNRCEPYLSSYNYKCYMEFIQL